MMDAMNEDMEIGSSKKYHYMQHHSSTIPAFFYVLLLVSVVDGWLLSSSSSSFQRSHHAHEAHEHARQFRQRIIIVLFEKTPDQQHLYEEIINLASSQHAEDFKIAQTKPFPIDEFGLKQADEALSSTKHYLDLCESIRHVHVPSASWRSQKLSILETTEPLFDESQRDIILSSAIRYWDDDSDIDPDKQKGSSFTLQSSNKREVHACDLDETAINVINDALVESIFPLLRHNFSSEVNDADNLFLYDSLVIEYDATDLEEGDKTALPSQPLHRDLGLVSVNIALSDSNEFTGGGTVFEALLGDDANASATLLPRSAGHALLHPSRERHAGGALTGGRRTILVMFISGISERKSPSWELGARCKAMGMRLAMMTDGDKLTTPGGLVLRSTEDRLATYRAATLVTPLDGEVYLLLAMTLLSAGSEEPISDVIGLLDEACRLNPNDGRIYNTLGLALKRQWVASKDQGNADLTRIGEIFDKAAKLHRLAAVAGCQGADAEARSALLNAGAWYAGLDNFSNSIVRLQQVCETGPVAKEIGSTTADVNVESGQHQAIQEMQSRRVVEDSQRLLDFCRKQVDKARA